jgi:hypothetical protein
MKLSGHLQKIHWQSSYQCNMLVKMEGFITEAVFSCTGGTNMTDSISQETPVSHYSLKQNDRSCNQSAEGQSQCNKMSYHNHKTVSAY